MLNLLGQGICRSYDEISLRIVYYSESQLRELEAVIKYAKLDTSTLELTELTEAIMKSFCINERHSPTSKYTCLLSVKARDHFIDKLGVQLDKESELFKLKSIDFIDTIVSEIMSISDDQLRENYLPFVFDIFSSGNCRQNPTIETFMQSGIISTLINFVENKSCSHHTREKSVQILSVILVYNSFGSSVFSNEELDLMNSVSNLVLDTYEGKDLGVIPYLVQSIASNATEDTRRI